MHNGHFFGQPPAIRCPRCLLYQLLLLLFLCSFLISHATLPTDSSEIPRPLTPPLQVVTTLAKCTSPNRTVYLRTESHTLVGVPPVATFVELTLAECAHKCSENIARIDCRSFEYDAQKRTCALKESGGKPFNSMISPKFAAQQPGLALYQQICIPVRDDGEAIALCLTTPYAFERFPQRVLSGHSMEVLMTGDLSECLAACLESRRRYHHGCRSAMFYYESGQCIINRESKQTSPQLFSADTQSQLVDYFENECIDVECGKDSHAHWFRVEDTRRLLLTNGNKELMVGGVETAVECRKMCEANRVGKETFPCRAYVFMLARRECQLSAESGIIHAKLASIMQVISRAGSGLEPPVHHSLLSPLTTGLYYGKICLEGPTHCEGDSFEMVANRMINVSSHGASAAKSIRTPSLSTCLQMCLEAGPSICASAMFFKQRDECLLSTQSQFSDPNLFVHAPDVDYYDNLCDSMPSKTASSAQIDQGHSTFTNSSKPFTPFLVGKESIINGRWKGGDPLRQPTRTSIMLEEPGVRSSELLINGERASLPGGKLSPTDPNSHRRKPLVNEVATTNKKKQKPSFAPMRETSRVDTQKISINTECRLTGIWVRATFDRESSGSLHLRDRAATCFQNFTDAREAFLEIPLPQRILAGGNGGEEMPPLSERKTFANSVMLSSDGLNEKSSQPMRCPGVELAPNVWSYLVVAQTNKVMAGSPFVVTRDERIYNVTCDYSNVAARAATPTTKPMRDVKKDKSEVLAEKPHSLLDVVVKMGIFRQAKLVSAVALGEELEMRWWLATTGSNHSGNELEEEVPRNNGANRRRLLGFFVDSCVAERLGGNSPAPPPLPLVVGGCPEKRVSSLLMRSPIVERNAGLLSTRIKMFRFDGSSRVRIRCSVKICVDRCAPVNCTFASFMRSPQRDVEWQSYGKRRRRRGGDDMESIRISDLAELLKHYSRVRGQLLAAEKTVGSEMVSHTPTSTPAQSMLNGEPNAEMTGIAIEQQPWRDAAFIGGSEGWDADLLLQNSATVSGSYTITDASRSGANIVRREDGIIYAGEKAEEPKPRGGGAQQEYTTQAAPPTIHSRSTSSTSSSTSMSPYPRTTTPAHPWPHHSTPSKETSPRDKSVSGDVHQPAADSEQWCPPSIGVRLGRVACLQQGIAVPLLLGVLILAIAHAICFIHFVHKRCGGEEEMMVQTGEGHNKHNSASKKSQADPAQRLNLLSPWSALSDNIPSPNSLLSITPPPSWILTPLAPVISPIIGDPLDSSAVATAGGLARYVVRAGKGVETVISAEKKEERSCNRGAAVEGKDTYDVFSELSRPPRRGGTSRRSLPVAIPTQSIIQQQQCTSASY